MKVSDLLEQATGDATAEYDVVVNQPGVTINEPRMWTVESAHRDTINGRLVLVVAEEITDE